MTNIKEESIQAFKKFANGEVVSCHSLDDALASVDFVALSEFDGEGYHPGYCVDNGIATINIVGLLIPDIQEDITEFGITGYPMVSRYLAQAEADNSVQGIVLDIDSGGGYVRGLDAVIEEIEATAKPVRAYVRNAYSAAYKIASTCEKLVANKQSGAGSIGVYLEFYDYSKAVENSGISIEVFKSGFWKGAFNNAIPLTQREREKLQEEVDFEAELFFEHVSNKRGIPTDTIREWEGNSWQGQEILTLNLVDSISTTIDAVFNDVNRIPEMDANKLIGKSGAKAEEAATGTPDIQALIDQAKADAVAEYQEKAKEAQAEAFDRSKAIFSSAAPEEIKTLLASDEFEGIKGESLNKLIVAIEANTFAKAMEEDGGAGVAEASGEFKNDPIDDATGKQTAEQKKSYEDALARIQESGIGAI